MKEPPYFKLTKTEPQTAAWAGLLLLATMMTAVGFAAQRLPAARGSTPQQRGLLEALGQAAGADGRAVVVESDGGDIRLNISSRSLFPPRGTELTPAGRELLNRVARALKASQGADYRQIEIEGHTERDGYTSSNYPRDNWELSVGQAVSALRQVSSASALDARLFSAHGYAGTRPSSAGNNRLEITVSFAHGGRLPPAA